MEQYLAVNNLWDVVSGVEKEPKAVADKAAYLQKQKSARAHIALCVDLMTLLTSSMRHPQSRTDSGLGNWKKSVSKDSNPC